MKLQLQQILLDILHDMGVTDVVPDVSISEDEQHGDYSTNIAMKLAKQLKKSPMDIALQVSQRVTSEKVRVTSDTPDQNKIKKDQKHAGLKAIENVLQAIDRVEVVAPGFINIFMSEAKLSSQIDEVLKVEERYGTTQTEQPLRIVVEFTDPNPFKEFHIGHLYSNSVGESLCRLMESQGNTVRRVCYQGDVGMHVAKAMYGLLQTSDLQSTMMTLEKQSLADRAKFLGAAYAAGAAAFEASDEAKQEIAMINKQVFAKHKAVLALYEQARQWSLEYFEMIYARLGTKFDGYYFESVVGVRGQQLVRDHVADGIFEESNGAIVYRGEKKALHTRVFINTLGLPTYEAKELGLAPTKYDDWNYDRSYIVTGNEINEYFKVLLAALGEISPELANITRHMGHGMVRNADGSKMSSRKGDVLTGEGLLDEVKESIYKLLDENKSNYTKEEHELIAEKAAVAAVKYSLLRVSLPSDVAFDLHSSVSFDGDSGPYLLYSYARCRSVLRKSDERRETSDEKDKNAFTHSPLPAQAGIHPSLNPEERALARLISFFPEIVADSAHNLAPNTLCSYLFKLAQAFNLFYQKHTILQSSDQSEDRKLMTDSSFRLALTAATSQVLKNGLYLLGISTVERM